MAVWCVPTPPPPGPICYQNPPQLAPILTKKTPPFFLLKKASNQYQFLPKNNPIGTIFVPEKPPVRFGFFLVKMDFFLGKNQVCFW